MLGISGTTMKSQPFQWFPSCASFQAFSYFLSYIVLPRGDTDLMTRKQPVRTSHTLTEHYAASKIIEVSHFGLLTSVVNYSISTKMVRIVRANTLVSLIVLALLIPSVAEEAGYKGAFRSAG